MTDPGVAGSAIARPNARSEAPQASTRPVNPSRPILLDVTLSYRSMGAGPDGILRAEREFALAALARPDLRVTFCRFDRRFGRWFRVAPRDVRFIATYQRDRSGRRRRGPRKWLADLMEIAASREVRRYRRLRWGLRRFLPTPALSGAIDAAAIGPDCVYTLAGLAFDTHDPKAIAALKPAAGMSVFSICYDVLPILHPEYFQSDDVVDRFRRFTVAMLGLSDRIACISRATERDLAAFATSIGLVPPDLVQLRLGCDIGRTPPPQRPPGLPPLAPRRFVLSVGNINIRKNHALLYRLWKRLAERRGERLPPLVVVGRIGWRADEVLACMRNDPLTRDSILLVDDARDDALAWLYANSLFTLYPSFYEGWGLPVSESLSQGRFCITSATSAMPEAASGLAWTLDPDDDAAWEAAVTTLLDDPCELAAREAEIAAKFMPVSWETAGAQFLNQALGTPPANNS